MKKTIGLFAHVDAGKTTFAEQLLFHTKSIRNRGRVDYQSAFLDNHAIEKKRGITVFADQAVMSFGGTTYYLIDTPGHVDFSSEMERSLQVLDYAIILISAVEGIQAHTETVWQLLRKHIVPTFFFINKTDRVGADVEKVLEDLRLSLTPNICPIGEPLDSLKDSLTESLITFFAERDERLLDLYLNGEYDHQLWLATMQRLIKDSQVFPVMSGSALLDLGVLEFLETLETLTYTDYVSEGTFAGRVYKLRHDANGALLTYVKVLQGTLHVRDEVRYRNGEHLKSEKITQIRCYSGNKYNAVDQASAGDLVAVTGLSEVMIGDGLGNLDERILYDIVPTLKAKVIFDPALNAKDVLRYFNLLNSEDPSLNVTWDEHLQDIHLHVMGTIQLEVLEQLVKERFNLTVTFGPPEILYKETITDDVMGYGHFEPLKHYAEVHLKLEPDARDSGITFASTCHPDELAVNYQNLIKHHLFEKEHHGILTGSPITDIKVTLTNGRAHVKHTSGGDFREATFRALRQGFEQAHNVLLEPYYDVRLKVNLEHIGRVLSDIQKAHGRFSPHEVMGNKAIITGRVPIATFMNYSTELASFTQGRGMISLSFGGYERCHNEDKIIKQRGYRKDADPSYSSSSVFCSKGQTYVVPWAESENHMHCL